MPVQCHHLPDGNRRHHPWSKQSLSHLAWMEQAHLWLRDSWHGDCSHHFTTAPLTLPVFFLCVFFFFLKRACPSLHPISRVSQSLRKVSDPGSSKVLCRQAPKVFLFLLASPHSVSRVQMQGEEKLKYQMSVIIVQLSSPRILTYLYLILTP